MNLKYAGGEACLAGNESVRLRADELHTNAVVRKFMSRRLPQTCRQSELRELEARRPLPALRNGANEESDGGPKASPSLPPRERKRKKSQRTPSPSYY